MANMKVEWSINIKQIGAATVGCSWDPTTKAPACSWTLNYLGDPLKIPADVAKAMIQNNPANVISKK